MKKLLIALIAAVLASGAFAQSFPDVPSGHWAEDAVERIADLNIVIGFPDGTFRGNEAFTRYQASLVVSRLLNIVNADMATMGARLSAVETAVSDVAAIENLQNQVAAQNVAVDTAQSAADANSAEIAALNDLIQLLGDQIETVQSDTTTADAVAALEGDVANIREFVILLRRDQVAIRDRVADVEGRMDAMEALDLDARVTALETNPLGFNGSIDLSYHEIAFGGAANNFDVDRAFGVGLTADMGASAFSTGTDPDFGPGDDDDEVDAAGEYAEDRADFANDGTTIGENGSDFDASITVGLGGDFVFDGESAPRGLNSFEAVATFILEDVDTDIADDSITQYVFGLESFSSTFEPIGAAPITVAFGEEVTASFTPYTLDAEQVGITASLGAPDMLAFLDPALHVAYLTSDMDGADLDEATLAVRGTLSPLAGLTGGVSYVTTMGNVADLDTANTAETVLGLDGAGEFGVGGLTLSLAGEYASYSDSEDANAAMDILFIEGGIEIADILGGVEIVANYRDIDTDWGNWAFADVDNFEFDADQVGFGVEAAFGLLIADVTAFYDSYTVVSTDVANSAFGVGAEADLFAGFSIEGYFESVTVAGAAADEDDMGNYDTGFGVALVHDGSADDALIANLNLELSYDAETVDFNVVTLGAAADYEATISILTLTPYVSFESLADGDDANNDATDLMVGTGLVTETLDVIFAPSLEAAVNYRSKAFSTLDYTADQLQWSVGLNLGEFLLPNTTLAARYGAYTATNWSGFMSDGPGANTGVTSAVSGLEVELNFFDLVFDYGMYDYDPNTAVADDQTKAQAFGVSYSVDF